ncbi:MAG: hypothetical protein GC136_00700 [Alphaproteobacteria bacterium]|nr:hypothetical protein [Alphaproteobacteria bacterium]
MQPVLKQIFNRGGLIMLGAAGLALSATFSLANDNELQNRLIQSGLVGVAAAVVGGVTSIKRHYNEQGTETYAVDMQELTRDSFKVVPSLAGLTFLAATLINL